MRNFASDNNSGVHPLVMEALNRANIDHSLGVLVDRREWETADSVYVSLVMPYYSHGIVDGGTSKSFVYDPGLRSHRNIRITEHGDLNEIYRRTYNDTTLYKPVKEDWYIELDHSQ